MTKSLDGLMDFLARRLTPEQYDALARTAAAQGLGLRDYVGRYVLKMVERKFEAERERDRNSIAGVIITATEKIANGRVP